MKVLLLQDVYKLGRAGDVKKVANGYGRNYLIPQGFAVLATPGALQQAERIRTEADARRAVLNQEMAVIAEKLRGVTLTFPARASETGRLYGSINTRMLAEAVSEEAGIEISHRQIDSQPLRNIGEHIVQVRLTVDLIPEIRAIVYREGETPALALEEAKALAEAEAAEAEVLEGPEVGTEDYLYPVEIAEMEPEAEVVSDAEAEPEAEVETETEAELEAETEAEEEAVAEVETEAEVDEGPDDKPEDDADAGA
jgi:large subunit ribosomal protein L9